MLLGMQNESTCRRTVSKSGYRLPWPHWADAVKIVVGENNEREGDYTISGPTKSQLNSAHFLSCGYSTVSLIHAKSVFKKF